MSLLAWIIVGAIAGWLGGMLMRNEQGLIGNIIVGIIGALVGGWVVQLFGGSNANGLNLYSILVALLGSIILLGIVNLFRRGDAKA